MSKKLVLGGKVSKMRKNFKLTEESNLSFYYDGVADKAVKTCTRKTIQPS
jgi:hypothetical protein